MIRGSGLGVGDVIGEDALRDLQRRANAARSGAGKSPLPWSYFLGWWAGQSRGAQAKIRGAYLVQRPRD